MKILKNVFLVFVAVSVSFLFPQSFGEIYADMFNAHGSWVNAVAIAGFPMVYILLITLLFTAFGVAKKYWWMGISLIPAAFVVFYLDWYHWYFWIAVGLLGWLAGFGLSKLIKTKTS
mgnify:CR=1 FL=1